MENDTVINVVLYGILGIIAFLVAVFSWFALTVDKDTSKKS